MTQDLYKQKKSLELSWEQEYNESGRYTLNMVKIDDKIREIVTEIKLEEAKVAHRVNKIEDSQAQVSELLSTKSYIRKNHSGSHNRLRSIQKNAIKNYYTI